MLRRPFENIYSTCKTTFLRFHQKLENRTKCIGCHSCCGTPCRRNLAPEASPKPTQPTDAFRPAPVPMRNGGCSASDAICTCISEYSHQYADRICSQRQFRLLRSSAASGRQNRQARADNRSGEGVLHGAGVEDAHDVAGEWRRKRGEERPVQPVLAVQLDDLRKHPRKSRYASVTSGADGNKTESNQTHFLVAELHKRCSGDH